MPSSRNFSAAAAARHFIDASSGIAVIDTLPDDAIPQTLEEAYAIQDAISAMQSPVLGWKAGDGAPPTCAPSYVIEKSGVTLTLAPAKKVQVETEFGFRALKDFPKRAALYTYDEVAPHLELLPLIEIVATRFVDRKAHTTLTALAAGKGNRCFIVGEPIANWQDMDLTKERVELSIDGSKIQSAVGTHPDPRPANLVVWQANHLNSRGALLRKGDVIATGSVVKGGYPAVAGQRAVATYGNWGKVEMSFR